MISSFVIAVYLVRPSTKALVNLLVLSVMVLSFWVGLNGLVFGQNGLEMCMVNHGRWSVICWYVPEFSALIHPFVEPRRLSVPQFAVSVYVGVTAVVLAVPLSTLIIRQLLGRLPQWLHQARKDWKI